MYQSISLFQNHVPLRASNVLDLTIFFEVRSVLSALAAARPQFMAKALRSAVRMKNSAQLLLEPVDAVAHTSVRCSA